MVRAEKEKQYLLLFNLLSSVSLKLIWNCKLFPDLWCSLPQLLTSHTTQSFKWEDETRVGWKQPFWYVLQHKQPHLLACFALADVFVIVIRLSAVCLPVVPLYVSVSFSLSRFYKESLPDLDDSAAGDCRHHLCFSLLVRCHHSREFLPKRHESMTGIYQSFHLSCRLSIFISIQCESSTIPSSSPQSMQHSTVQIIMNMWAETSWWDIKEHFNPLIFLLAVLWKLYMFCIMDVVKHSYSNFFS